MHGSWKPITIEEAASRLAAFDVDWWVAGGQAIDMFLGWQSRSHDDLDLEMFRKDREVLFDVFGGWQLFTMSSGALTRWRPGDDIEPHVFGVWGKPEEDAPWAVEVMLANGDGTEWRFRRNPEISMGRERLTLSSGSFEYCTPEVQLLYKAKQARPKDDVDFARVLHLLSLDQAAWLLEALAVMDPNHPWIGALEFSPRLNAQAG